MSGFIASSSYNICTENEVANILSHFSYDYIYDVIRDSINQNGNLYQMTKPNIIASFEQHFKQMQMVYDNPDDINKIEQTRTETYRQVLEILSQAYNLEINYENIQDYFSIAFYLYDLLVSGFNTKMVEFFTNYIIKEKNVLYDTLELNNMKKSKDTSTIYNKKMYKNTKLAIINANLEYVLHYLTGFDITFNTILNTIYQDKNMIKFIESIVAPKVNFFTVYTNLLNSNIGPILLTNIRLAIQQQSMNEEINITNIK